MRGAPPESSQSSPGRVRSGRVEATLLGAAVALAGTLLLPPRPAAVIATTIVVLGTLRGLVARQRAGRMRIDDLGALEHQLARWRRRSETAALLVVEPSPGHPARHLAPSLRTTDAVALISGTRGPRVLAALDDQGLDRRGLELRLIAMGADPSRLGWASFPGDGTTLEALVASAMAAIERQVRPAPPAPAKATQRPGRAAGAAGDRSAILTHAGGVQ